MNSKQKFATGRRLIALSLLLAPLSSWATEINVSGDTYVSPAANANLNYGTLTSISVGPLGVANAQGNSALIQMNLSALPAGLTAVNVQKATLTVYVNKVLVAGGLDFAQVTNSWTETGVTFATQPGSASAFAVNVPVAASGNYVTVDVTALVKGWVQGTFPNDGIQIAAAFASPATQIVLDSKEATTTSHPASLDVTIVSVGPSGPTGVAGATGVAGPTGSTGPSGASGITGATGATGATGTPGANGATGATGSNGTNGTNGTNGATGATGATGSNGTNGTNGTNGATGATGSNGTNGANGANGPTGPTGLVAAGHVAMVFMATSGAGFSGTATLALNGTSFAAVSGAIPETVAEVPMSGTCTFDRLDLKLASGSGATSANLTTTITLFKNGSATALFATAILPSGSNQSVTGSDTVHTVSVTPGDTVVYELSNSSAQANALLKIGSHCQ